jgi:F-type H+-transporting ATPase subunit delta
MASGKSDLGLARTYSRAILALAEQNGQGDALAEELDDLVELLDRTPELERFLASPLVGEDGRRQTIEKAFRGKASDLLVDSLQVINRKGRAGDLRAVAASYREELRQLRGHVQAKVKTAVPLTDGARQGLQEALRRFTGKEPDLAESVDPRLLGGVEIEVAGQKIDTSVASRLRELSDRLLNRASIEIQRGTASYIGE